MPALLHGQRDLVAQVARRGLRRVNAIASDILFIFPPPRRRPPPEGPIGGDEPPPAGPDQTTAPDTGPVADAPASPGG